MYIKMKSFPLYVSSSDITCVYVLVYIKYVSLTKVAIYAVQLYINKLKTDIKLIYTRVYLHIIYKHKAYIISYI